MSDRVPPTGPGTDSAADDAFGHQRTAESATDAVGSSQPGAEADAEPAAESESRLAAEPLPGDDRQADPVEDPLAVAVRERDEYKDALIRLQADFENYKKRMLKQQTEHLERAAGVLVEKLLPVLDAADLALAHGAGEDVKQLTSALFGALEREGLERIDPAGGPFDPTLHDAVAHEPAEGDQHQQEVSEVMRAGYRWKGRVLRPAMVKVRG